MNCQNRDFVFSLLTYVSNEKTAFPSACLGFLLSKRVLPLSTPQEIIPKTSE